MSTVTWPILHQSTAVTERQAKDARRCGIWVNDPGKQGTDGEAMIWRTGETGRWRANDGGVMARYSGEPETGWSRGNDDGVTGVRGNNEGAMVECPGETG